MDDGKSAELKQLWEEGVSEYNKSKRGSATEKWKTLVNLRCQHNCITDMGPRYVYGPEPS